MSRLTNRMRRWAGLVTCGLFLVPTLKCQQQQETVSSNASAVSDQQTLQDAAPNSGFGSEQPLPAASPGFLARALNSANPLDEENGPLHWGWLSIRSASFLQYSSHVSFGDASLKGQNPDLNSSQFSTALVLAHAFRTSQLSLQYNPSLFISNGSVYSNTLNQSAGADTSFQLNPRLTLQISDRFNYYGSQRYFSENSLGVNYLTGASVQNAFLDGPGSVLYNSATANFSYLWSPQTTVALTPLFNYQRSTGAVISGDKVTAFYEGGRVAVSHLLSENRTVGISYSAQYADFNSVTSPITISRPPSSGVLQDLLVSYGQQLSPTWRVVVGVGVSTNSTGAGGSFLGLNGTITKTTHRMEFAVTYNRGHQFNGFITSAGSNRVDFVHTIYWNQRLSTTSSVAYFSDLSGAATSESAFYGTERLNFKLNPQLTLSLGGTYISQHGDGVFSTSGIRRFATFGLVWRIAPPQR